MKKETKNLVRVLIISILISPITLSFKVGEEIYKLLGIKGVIEKRSNKLNEKYSSNDIEISTRQILRIMWLIFRYFPDVILVGILVIAGLLLLIF